MITPTNQTKTALSPENQTKGLFFLLQENGDYLLQENSDLILLDLPSYAFTGTNQLKTAISPTNALKS